MTEVAKCPSYFVQSVDEHNGKPCVAVYSNGFYYLLTNLETTDEGVVYDLAVGKPILGEDGGDPLDEKVMIEWLDDAVIADLERHGDLADLIVADVIGGLE